MVLSPAHRSNDVQVFEAHHHHQPHQHNSGVNAPSSWSNPSVARGPIDSHHMSNKANEFSNVPLGKQVVAVPAHHHRNALDDQIIDRVAPPTDPRDHSDDLHPSRWHPTHAQASVFSTSINLTNTCIGIGMLTLPQAVATCGWILGMLMLAFGAATAYFGMYLQTRSAARLAHNAPTWHTMAAATFPRARFLVDAIVMIQSIGLGAFYLVMIGLLIPAAIQGFYAVANDLNVLDQRLVALPEGLGSRYVWIAVAAVICVPLSFVRNLNHLRFSSIFGIMAVLLMTIMTIIFYAVGDTPSPLPIPTSETNQERDPHLISLAFIPLFIFAYAAHMNTFTAWSELKHRTVARMNSANSTAICLSLVLYTLIAVFAFLSFGDFVDFNYLLTYLGRPLANEGPVMLLNCVRLIAAIHLMTCYPLQAHPFRTAMRDTMSNCCGRRDDARRGLAHKLHRNKNPHGRDWAVAVIATIPFILATFAIAFATENIWLFINLIGSTVSIFLIFILPGLFFWKLTDPRHIIRRGDNNDCSHSLLAGGYPHMASYQGVGVPAPIGLVHPQQGIQMVDANGMPMVHQAPVEVINQHHHHHVVNVNNGANAAVVPHQPVVEGDLPVSHGMRMMALAFAVFGMLFVPFAVVVTILFELDELRHR